MIIIIYLIQTYITDPVQCSSNSKDLVGIINVKTTATTVNP